LLSNLRVRTGRAVELKIETCRATAALLDVTTLLAARSVSIECLSAYPSSPATATIRCAVHVPAGRADNLVARLRGLPRVLAVTVVVA
jgi:(p)ppGpp synthase/HD superfamily hydrolase